MAKSRKRAEPRVLVTRPAEVSQPDTWDSVGGAPGALASAAPHRLATSAEAGLRQASGVWAEQKQKSPGLMKTRTNDLSRYFSEKTHERPVRRGKLLSLTGGQRNASQTAARHHLVPVRTATVKAQKTSSVGDDVEELEPSCWCYCKTAQPLWETARRGLKKNRRGTITRPSGPSSGSAPERTESRASKRHLHPTFRAAPLTAAKTRRPPKCPEHDRTSRTQCSRTADTTQP